METLCSDKICLDFSSIFYYTLHNKKNENNSHLFLTGFKMRLNLIYCDYKYKLLRRI